MVFIDRDIIKIEVQKNDSFNQISNLIYIKLLEWKNLSLLEPKTQFLENPDMLPTIISVILGTITSGFLKQIGKEIWSNFKKIFIKKEKTKLIPKFKFNFTYNGVDIIVSLETDDFKTLELALKTLNNILEISCYRKEDLQSINFILDETSGIWKIKNKDVT